MQDTILLQYLSKKIHTHAYKLTIDGEITFSCCKVLAFQDTYIKDKDFLDFLLESLPQGIPCLRSIRQKNIYGIVTGHNAIYIVGPVSFASPVYLNCDYNELILEEEIEKYVPQVNPDDYLEDILFLNHMITGVESTTEQIIETNCLNHDHTGKVQKHFNDILFENHENNVHHNPYDQEMREFGSIENGDLIQLEKSLQEDYDGTIGTLAKDPLRNLKNLGIVLVTLASRAAIRGGLSPEISFSLSDSYIQQIEECKDLALVAPLAHKAEFQYAEMVHEIKEKQKGILKKQKNPRINKCKDFIFSHLHDRITLEDLAAEADCNPNYLSQLFKECEGISISGYILQEKINRAKNLLIYSDYSYIEIATYLGFSSQSHLGTQFKKHTGYTLRQYREIYGRKE
ncbi:AraC family transcriptional regulator [Clostridium sp. AM49-4BH]|uniref:helix-turn-helix domain-containing protein n=1 Tax=Clostridium sp. AM49-4BH TaxID=2293035 RepID=UPI000E55102D|nr:AraC family transcriptional regulator [Clostridium sp. AM49-4BH]RHQ12963.1 AraC family transcriptional regulator [Clostridium sp. AM49-4BH]